MMVAKSVEEEEQDLIGDVVVAEYVVLVLATSKYAAFVETSSGQEGAEDNVLRDGIRLVRLIDSQQGEALQAFFQQKLTRPVSQKAVDRSLRIRISGASQLGRRAVTLRSALDRNGSATIQAIFDNAQARRSIKASLAAHTLSDTADAFDDFSTLTIRNTRIKQWLKEAREAVGKGTVLVNPVDVAVSAVADKVKTLKTQQVTEESTMAPEEVQESKDQRSATFDEVQTSATQAARAALEDAGDPDEPPTRSEVIGIAAAAAAAATSNTANEENIPKSLRRLDAEQRSAALTDGRVLVSAGAGAGKSTTLVARVEYLVDERHVDPSRILVCSFNKEASDELGHKIGRAIGGAKASQATIGTLHKVFKGCISDFGNPEEQAMFPKQKFGAPRKSNNDPILSGSAIAAAVNRIWRKCFATPGPDGKLTEAEPPQARQMMMAKTRWAGNGVTPAMAKAQAQSAEDHTAALWYEMYEGLKGSIPRWRPSCEDRPDADYEFNSFNRKWRERTQGGRTVLVRLGDFDDMISTCLAIMKRNPGARQSLQSKYDHIMVDECQDLNLVQHEALSLMTEHIDRDATDKSFWMVGDDKQSIYDFRGAQPAQFTAKATAEDTKLRQIKTNYRCPPEVVDAANRLISNNKNQIEMEANPAPGKARGVASVKVSSYADEADTAISIAAEIKASWDDGEPLSSNAILCRTRNELNAFETGLLMRGIPYARSGASSFLSAPETKAFMGYVTLVSDSDTEKTQAALVDVINKPNRFFLKGGVEEAKRAVDNAIHLYARKMSIPKKSVNAFDAIRDYDFQQNLLRSFGTPPKHHREAMEVMDSLVQGLYNLQEVTEKEASTTKDMFNAVLDMPGVSLKYNERTGRSERVRTTFSEELNISVKDYGGEDDDSPPDSASDGKEEMGLGNIGFLYELAKPDPSDPADAAIPPNTPKGFFAKMGRLTEKAKELRIDLNEWNKAQKEKAPEDREPPPGVYLGTIHSTKGAQWDNVILQMPNGRFPMLKRRKDGEEITPEMAAEDERKIESERRLAYVAMTRPKKNLRIVAPREYNGKPAGLSMFVGEAGLTSGENVEKPGGPDVVKTAGVFAEDDYFDVVAREGTQSYDWLLPGGADGWV